MISEQTVLYAISVNDTEGIPAVEQDLTTNEYNLLVFTSKEAAQRYCYLRKASLVHNIYQLDKATHKGKLLQTGLMRIARICLNRYQQITGVIFDHPGVSTQEVEYATIKDIVASAKKQIPKSKAYAENLVDYLSAIDDE